MDNSFEINKKFIIKKEICENEEEKMSGIEHNAYCEVSIKTEKWNVKNNEFCSNFNVKSEEFMEIKDEVEERVHENWLLHSERKDYEEGIYNEDDEYVVSSLNDAELNCDSVSNVRVNSDLSSSLKNMYGLSDVQLQNLSILFRTPLNPPSRNFVQKVKRESEQQLFDGIIQTFSCGICNKVFKTKSHLKSHMVIHSDVKNFSCNICHREFNYKTNLEKHMLTHTGIKRHECHLCLRKFTLNSHLKAHLDRHEKHKQLVCKICSKQFYKKAFLTTHMKMHEGLEVYICDLCNNEFRRKYHLIQHLRQVHTDEKDYVCNICNMSFNQKSNLNRHIRRHIGENSCSFN